MENTTLVCEACGSRDLTRREDGLTHCDRCGMKYTITAIRQMLESSGVKYASPDFIIIGDTLVKYRGEEKDVLVPEGVKYIGPEAFRYNDLESIILPEGVKSIGRRAFLYCTNLDYVFLPTTLETIGENAFACCWHLQDIDLPSGLKEIGYSAFTECYELGGIELPASLKVVGDLAFTGCSSLYRAVLHDGIETLHSGAFYETEGLDEVALPDPCPNLGWVDSEFAGFKFTFGQREVSCRVNEKNPFHTDLLVSGKKVATFFAEPDVFEDRLIESVAPMETKQAIRAAWRSMRSAS